MFLPFVEPTELDAKIDALVKEITAAVYAWKERHVGHELEETFPLIGGGALVKIRCLTCPDDHIPLLLSLVDRSKHVPVSTQSPLS